MAFGNQPTDAGLIPTSSVYNQSNQFYTLQGEPGAYQDANSNASTAAVMSFLQPKIVQKANNITGSAGKTLTCAFSSNNIAGNSIVIVMGMGEVDNGSTITLAVTDTPSNSYTSAVKATQSTTLEAAIFYATNIAAGANTITITIAGASSTNTAIGVEIYEVWGLIAQAGAFDQSSTGNNAGSTSPATSAIVPLVPNELAFAAISAAGGTITAGTSWTLDSGSLAPTGGNLVSFGSESRQLSTMASTTGTATLSGSNAWAIAMATFKSVIVPVEGTMQIGAILAGLSQANQIPVSNAGQQGKLTLSLSSLTANSDNSITFSGNATVARRIRIQNESSGTIYWEADATASTGSPALAAPASNAVMVEWINIAVTTLHIWIPTGGTTTLNGSGGVKVTAWA